MNNPKQVELIHKIQDIGINLVHCGNCGEGMLVESDEDEHHCLNCSFTSDPCDFPDAFYTGMKRFDYTNPHDLNHAVYTSIRHIEKVLGTSIEVSVLGQATVEDRIKKLTGETP